ncbi:STAS domain-containing protein [Streptomyces sp. t39]|uniref:STAS domain-containing protein n=1 Tax=Streptomyces sp. t39 TaxID=1828156 RepID=UPI0011CEB74A|nr:STAS domain-containing protein [Streptomyces sp. t39]TXS44431.1 anti-sigma factor antagonist [Streptomyces sp. t39]
MNASGTGEPPEEASGDGRFAVREGSRGGVVVLSLAGELDHDTAEPLREALARHTGTGAGRVLVDLSGLTFCDSTGLNVLLHARLAAHDTGGSIELAGLRPPVARMFEITGAHTVFRVHAGLDEALARERPA